MQDLDTINAIIEPETGWRVELSIAPEDGSECLQLYRKIGATWDQREVVAELPRNTGAIVAFGMLARHYHNLGRKLGYELDGVLYDIKHNGLDQTCIDTVTRVRVALHTMSITAETKDNEAGE